MYVFYHCRILLNRSNDLYTFILIKIRCPLAIHRIVEIGIPATVEHTSAANNSANITKHVAETVQIFITLLDALKLNMTAVDQIQPQLSDLAQALNSVTSLPASYMGKSRIHKWLCDLNQRRASDELSNDESRQLSFDLESSLNEFHRALSFEN
jgi:ESCRT-I complex subunit VPS28